MQTSRLRDVANLTLRALRDVQLHRIRCNGAASNANGAPTHQSMD